MEKKLDDDRVGQVYAIALVTDMYTMNAIAYITGLKLMERDGKMFFGCTLKFSLLKNVACKFLATVSRNP